MYKTYITYRLKESRHELVLILDSQIEMKEITEVFNTSEVGLKAIRTKMPPAQLVISTREETITSDNVQEAVLEECKKYKKNDEIFDLLVAKMGGQETEGSGCHCAGGGDCAPLASVNNSRDGAVHCKKVPSGLPM